MTSECFYEDGDYSSCGEYYKCNKDGSEGCRTKYIDCSYNYETYGELCAEITYFDDYIGEDKYVTDYGSYYNATYWEYYDGYYGVMTYDNATASTCDEE